jgi:myosin heavy subunit
VGSINVHAKRPLSNFLCSHARAGPTQRHESLHTHNELHLLSKQQRARARVETEEALFKDPQVRATLWLSPLPEKQTGSNSIFDILADEWTQPALDAAQLETNCDAGLKRHIEQLARRLQEQEKRGRQADALIADLQHRHESNERRRQEDRDVIQSLESRLQEQEQQSRKDGALIVQLQERCRQWIRYCNGKEGEMKRLQTQLDSLARAYREQRRETQRLQHVYQALKTENDKLRKEQRALQLETRSLHSKNNNLLRENKTLRDEKENATRTKKVVEQQCERLERELARIKSERDSWLKHACNLRDRIATQSAMGPTSFPLKRSSRRGSYSSGGSSSTYATSSRESSKERRT